VAERPRLFVAACIAYFTAAVLLIIARRLRWSSLRIVALVNASVSGARPAHATPAQMLQALATASDESRVAK